MTVWAEDHSPAFVGREAELAGLTRLLGRARSGSAVALVVHGEPGTGKTALLGRTARLAPDFDVVRVAGVESESTLPFAAVQRLVEPFLETAATLPTPQHQALLIATGRLAGAPPARFLVGLALLSLLSEVANQRPLLCLVDDLQWLDHDSRDVLAFTARRLGAEAIALVFTQRTGTMPLPEGIESVELTGLARPYALKLLRAVLDARPVDPRIADEIVTATGGNPLALIELADELSATELAGDSALAEPLPVGASLERHYLGLIRNYPEPTRTWLVIAAAEPSGDPRRVAEAAFALGLPEEAARPAERDRLVTTTTTITFRHPLARSAIYRGATGTDVRRAHAALAKVTSRFEDGDHRAWHLAAAAAGPDENVAAELAAASARAGQRGGYAARALFLTRAAGLTPPGPLRAVRTVEAAQAATLAGSPVQALALLDRLADDDTAAQDGEDVGHSIGKSAEATELVDRITLSKSLTSRALAEKFTGAPLAASRAPARFIEASRAIRAIDPDGSRDALLAAFEHAIGAEWMMSDLTLEDLAAEARAVAIEGNRGSSTPTDVLDVLLRALGELARSPDGTAAPSMRAAIDALLASPSEADVLRCGISSVAITTAMWDDQARVDLLRALADAARRRGALQVLDTALWVLGAAETVHGQLDIVDDLIAEVYDLRESVGLSAAQARVFPNAELLAWRGPDSAQLRTRLKASGEAATYLGIGGAQTMARTAVMLLDIAAGEYSRAYDIASAIHAEGFMQICIRGLPDLIESAVRSGHGTEARAALERLDDIASASGTKWGLGVLERSRALIGEESGGAAESFEHAIDLLRQTRARADLARAHLLYGEWLRRRRRRSDAARQLSEAIDLFDVMRAEPFGARARRELVATGGASTVRAARTPAALTGQERAVAELAGSGATNAEIAAMLFISPNTVAFHLRKVFRKLNVSSRRQLSEALPPRSDAGWDAER